MTEGDGQFGERRSGRGPTPDLSALRAVTSGDFPVTFA